MSLSDIIYLQRGRNELARHSGEPPARPPWLDTDKFNRGRQFFQEYYFCCFLSMFTSLACGLTVENLLRALVFTNASNNPQTALSRYMRTFRHVSLWHFEDVWDNESAAFRSIVAVRGIHDKVARNMNTNNHRIHFSQYDMALVQCGFMGAIVMYPEAYGSQVSEAEVDDYVHFWRATGYLLGIDDEYNLCTDGTARAKAKCQAIEQHVLLPAMENPPDDSRQMVDALIGASNSILWGFPLFSCEAVMAFGLDNMKQPRPDLHFVDKLRFYVLKCLAALLKKFKVCRYLLNRCLEGQIARSPG